VPLTGSDFLKNVDGSFNPNVTTGNDVYGVPFGYGAGGGVLYNRTVYDRLGLQVPKTWSQFMANNAKVKGCGHRPRHPVLPRTPGLVVLASMVAFVLQRRASRWNGPINFLILSELIIPLRWCRPSGCCRASACSRRSPASS